jgi:protein-S-isoprenylcysteine O-methyltransferase Ste14
MVGTHTHQTSSRYAVAQNIILCGFAATFFLTGGSTLVPAVPYRAVGSAVCAAGLVVMFAAMVSIGNAVQIAPEPRAGAKLATTGIYSYLRHPIYTGILILVAGLFLRKPTLAVGSAAAIVVAFLLIKAQFEERLLLDRYPKYAEYRRRTWGIAPGFRG